MFSRPGSLTGSTEEKNRDKNEAADPAEICFRPFHARIANNMPVKTLRTDHRLQKK